MFGFFKKKQVTAMDALINSIYGPNPPSKTADPDQASRLAYEALLQKRVNFSDVSALASDLNAGPIPYSTCDLAASIALNFFKRPELQASLAEAQLPARMQVLDWVKQQKLNRQIALTFENVLYAQFKPEAVAPKKSAKNDEFIEYLQAGIAGAEKEALDGGYVPAKYNNLFSLVKTLDAQEGGDRMNRWCFDLCSGAHERGASIEDLSTLLLLFHWENYIEYSTGVRPDVTKSPTAVPD
jgi:hypothetical protein